MEELEHGEDRLLHTPCGADARQSLIFQVLSRRRGEDDRRVGCGSAVYGNCIILRALQECTGLNSHFVGRVLSARGAPAKPWLCMRGLVARLRATRERTFRPPAATCAICFDELPPRAFITLCGANHQFCVDCAWPSCKAMLEEGLVPACPHDREQKCGPVPKAAAEEALKRWLKQEDTEARKAQLDSWSIKGLTSGKLSGVYLSAARAAQGAFRCCCQSDRTGT